MLQHSYKFLQKVSLLISSASSLLFTLQEGYKPKVTKQDLVYALGYMAGFMAGVIESKKRYTLIDDESKVAIFQLIKCETLVSKQDWAYFGLL